MIRTSGLRHENIGKAWIMEHGGKLCDQQLRLSKSNKIVVVAVVVVVVWGMQNTRSSQASKVDLIARSSCSESRYQDESSLELENKSLDCRRNQDQSGIMEGGASSACLDNKS